MRFKDKVKADDNRKRAFTYLTQEKGLEAHIAAGILGNFMQESGHKLDVEAYNPNDLGKPSFGLAQWRGDRMNQLKKVAGKKANTLEGQLDFMMWEFDNTEKRAFKKLQEASTSEEAALAFSQYYERPHKDYAHNDKRVAHAKGLYNNYVGENEDGYMTKDLGDPSLEGNTPIEGTVNNEETYQEQGYDYSGYQVPVHNSGQALSLDAYAEQEVAQDNTAVAQTPILDAAVSRIESKKAEMAALQQMMKANQVQYIDPNETSDPEPNSYGYPSMQEGGDTNPIPSVLDQFQGYGTEEPKEQEPVRLMQVPKRRGRTNEREKQPLNYAVRETTEVARRDTSNPLLSPVVEKEVKEGTTPETFEQVMDSVNNPITYKEQLQEKLKVKSDLLNPLGDDKIDPTKLKTPEEIEKLQRQLEENGYHVGEKGADGIMGSDTRAAIDRFNTKASLSSEISVGDYKTPEQIKQLQEFLITQDFDVNPDGKFEDDGVDGKLGEATEKAVREYNKKVAQDSLPWQTVYEGQSSFLGKCAEKQCSEYVQNAIWRNLKPQMSRADWNKKTGLHGDAWDIGKNIINAGGRELKINQVASGDVVTIQTEGSNYVGQAGSNITHTGVVDQVNDDGTYYIIHNVHKLNDAKNDYIGQEYRDLVNPNSGKVGGDWKSFKVAHAYRASIDGKNTENKAKPLRKDVKLAIDPTQAERLGDIKSLFSSAPEKIETFLEPLNDYKNKQKFSQIFGLEEDEYQTIAQLTLGVLGQETNFGTTLVATAKEPVAQASWLMNRLTDGNFADTTVMGKKIMKTDEVSKGAGQLKYDTNFHADLNAFGINKKNFDDDKNAAITSFYKLSTDYKRFREKGFSKKDAAYRAATVYNASLQGESGGKKREDWAKDYDVDYANKVITLAGTLGVQGAEGKQYKTVIDDLLVEDNVIKWKDKTFEGRNF